MKFKWTLFFVALQFSFIELTIAQESSSSGSRPWLLSRGAAAREAKRFNLYDWMEQKNRNQVMDMWLSLNSPSPYEFMIGVNLNQYTRNTLLEPEKKFSAYEGELSAYANLVGLTGEYQNNTQEGLRDETGMFNLRIFGHTLQGTHLTLHYGLRTRYDKTVAYRLNQQFAAGTLQLYLFKYFGIYGQYRHFFAASNNTLGDTKTNYQNLGAFIDFASLRIMGTYFKEQQRSSLNNVESLLDREGSKVTVQLYF